MNVLLQDLRHAARSLRRSPGFTLAAVLTLALGIGATTAIFSVVDAVILRPLAYPEPDRLVHVWETTPEGNDFSSSDPNYLDFRAQSRAFQELGAYRRASFTLTGGAEPERTEGMAATHSFFDVLGATPALGRTFLAEEDRPGGDTRRVVLSHGLWQRRFGSDPGLVGRAVQIDGQEHVVTGVMRPGFDFSGAELWVPLAPDPAVSRDDHWLGVIGRLRPGVTPEQADAELSGLTRRIAEEHPQVAGWEVRVATFSQWLVDSQFRRTAFVLLGAVGFLLLLACANLANLLFARATARRTEIGIRAALGAGRSRIVRQLLTESALLALIGAAVGLAGAFWAVEALQALEPAGIPRLDEVGIDGRAVGFTLLVGLLTSLVFGLAPATRASRVDLHDALKQGGRGGTSAGHLRVRDALVVCQVALAMVLLVGAGLLVRSFIQLQGVDPGFKAENVLAVPLQLDPGGDGDPERASALYAEIISGLENVPGVLSAGATMVDPFSGWNLANDVTPEERAAEVGPSGYLQAGWRVATPGFFETMRIPLLRGRLFSDADPADGPGVVVVSETLARRLWPDEDPIGKGLFWGGVDGEPRRVVGVVGDYRDVRLADDPPPLLFLPHHQIPWPTMTVVVRTAGPVAGTAAALRRQIREVGPSLAVPEVRPLERYLAEAVAGPRFRTLLLGAFSAVALLLAAVGIYGVMTFSVARRTREMGVRLALGARPGDVSGMILRRGMVLTLAGVALGLVGAWGLSRSLASLLYDTAPTDPATFAAVSLLLAGFALLASYLPARRASRVDPVVALRSD